MAATTTTATTATSTDQDSVIDTGVRVGGNTKITTIATVASLWITIGVGSAVSTNSARPWKQGEAAGECCTSSTAIATCCVSAIRTILAITAAQIADAAKGSVTRLSSR